MKYRDIDYTVVQGLGRLLWKWEFAIEGQAAKGQAKTKADAIRDAEHAIDKDLAIKTSGQNDISQILPNPFFGATQSSK